MESQFRGLISIQMPFLHALLHVVQEVYAGVCSVKKLWELKAMFIAPTPKELRSSSPYAAQLPGQVCRAATGPLRRKKNLLLIYASSDLSLVLPLSLAASQGEAGNVYKLSLGKKPNMTLEGLNRVKFANCLADHDTQQASNSEFMEPL